MQSGTGQHMTLKKQRFFPLAFSEVNRKHLAKICIVLLTCSPDKPTTSDLYMKKKIKNPSLTIYYNFCLPSCSPLTDTWAICSNAWFNEGLVKVHISYSCQNGKKNYSLTTVSPNGCNSQIF